MIAYIAGILFLPVLCFIWFLINVGLLAAIVFVAVAIAVVMAGALSLWAFIVWLVTADRKEAHF